MRFIRENTKAIAAAAGVLLLAGIPLALYRHAHSSLHNYLADTYGSQGLLVESLRYDTTQGDFTAEVSSASEVDTHFTVGLTLLGQVQFDTYSEVLSGETTAQRLEDEYRELVADVFDAPGSEYYIDRRTAEISRSVNGALLIARDGSGSGIPLEDLERNGSYDVKALGAQAGDISILYRDTAATYDRAAEILLDVKEKLDAAGVGFAQISICLDGETPGIEITAFPAEDIAGEDLAQRLQSWAAGQH